MLLMTQMRIYILYNLIDRWRRAMSYELAEVIIVVIFIWGLLRLLKWKRWF